MKTLTPREIQVADLLAQGLRDREVAARLGITPRAFRKHFQSLSAKLGALSRIGLGIALERARRERIFCHHDTARIHRTVT